MSELTVPDSIVTSFEEEALKSPDSIALRWSDGSWSYAELNARANRLAHFLIAAGVKPEYPVGVFALRSPETLLSLLAILKAGGVYVPLDPSYPEDRTHYCIEDAGIRLILSDPKETMRLHFTSARVMELQENPHPEQPATNPKCLTNSQSAAQIFYTSGSTGRPKGVVIEHRGVLRLAKHANYLEIGPGETLLQFTPLNYDVSTFEIWTSWLNGACLALPPSGLTTLHALGQVLRFLDVSMLLMPSSLLPLMVDQEIDSLAGVRQLVVGGDVLSPAHAAKFLKKYPESRMFNAYGPTENTVITTCQRLKLEDPMPARLSIGRPIPKTEVLILDDNLKPVPKGEIGEMVMTGDGLARGYLNQPELTDQAFVQIVNGAGRKVRAYRSGDLGRYNPDGSLDFCGRKDEQVKINGLRIELGEIKSVLLSHPAIAEAEVLLVAEDLKKRLEVFVVPKSGASLDEQTVRKFLEQKIPGNWRPSGLRVVPSLPRGVSGKVDRRALLENLQALSKAQESDAKDEPQDPTEKAIWEIWRSVLPHARVTLNDRFVELGGDSLSALKMIARVEETFGRPVGLRPLLEGGTIGHIAAAVRQTEPLQAMPLMRCAQAGSTDKTPFFFAHGDYTCGGLYCQKLSSRLGADQPFYAIAPLGTFDSKIPASFEEAGAKVVELIRSVQPKGPYRLGGYCNGALGIYEIAQQLIRSGEQIETLVLLDPPDLYLFLLRERVSSWGQRFGLRKSHSRDAYHRIAEAIEIWEAYGFLRLVRDFFTRTGRWFLKNFQKLSPVKQEKWIAGVTSLNAHYYEVIADYKPERYGSPNDVWVILREEEKPRHPRQISYWTSFIPQARFEVVPGHHLELQSKIDEISDVVRKALNYTPPQPENGEASLLHAELHS